MKDTDYAYVAGLIDGEGSIHIEETKGKWYAPRMGLGMTKPALSVMTELHQEYGGTLRIMRPATEKWAEAWMFYVHGADCEKLLRDVIPYLKIKKHHAELALQVSEIRNALPRRTNGQSVWTEAAREKCREIKQAVKELNRKGPRATAGSAEDA